MYNYKVLKREDKNNGQVELTRLNSKNYTLVDVIQMIKSLDAKLDNVIKLNNLKTE
jgi:hypothetical protein